MQNVSLNPETYHVFSARIYGPRASRLGHESERKKTYITDLELG